MRHYGLIGFPLSHSFSGIFFREKFSREGISDAVYSLLPIDDLKLLPGLLNSEPELLGVNVTIPYKTAVLPMLDQLSEEALKAGAVNCIKIRRTGSERMLTGYNTDVYGFREALLPMLRPEHTSALVLGTGGASRAVAFALNELGIRFTLVSRTASAGVLSYSELDKEHLTKNRILINTTPLGMFPETEACPDIPYEFLTSAHLLFDLIYNPAETLFMKKGKAAGARVMNGDRMLRLQAERSWEIWNDESLS
jgi:shikimate dehydrogenase